MDPSRLATKDAVAELRDDISKVRLDNARQTRQLTLTILLAVVAQFTATTAVMLSMT